MCQNTSFRTIIFSKVLRMAGQSFRTGINGASASNSRHTLYVICILTHQPRSCAVPLHCSQSQSAISPRPRPDQFFQQPRLLDRRAGQRSFLDEVVGWKAFAACRRAGWPARHVSVLWPCARARAGAGLHQRLTLVMLMPLHVLRKGSTKFRPEQSESGVA